MKSRQLVETLLAEEPAVGGEIVGSHRAAELLRGALLKVTGGKKRGALGVYAYGAQIDFRVSHVSVLTKDRVYAEFSAIGKPTELVLAEIISWLSRHDQADVDRLHGVFSRAAAGKLLADE